jgi:hypothetical protein
MRNALSDLLYFRIDVLLVLFAIQFLVLAVKGKAIFPSGMNAAPRFSTAKVKAMWGKYLCVIVAAGMLARVVWDLHRKFAR